MSGRCPTTRNCVALPQHALLCLLPSTGRIPPMTSAKPLGVGIIGRRRKPFAAGGFYINYEAEWRPIKSRPSVRHRKVNERPLAPSRKVESNKLLPPQSEHRRPCQRENKRMALGDDVGSFSFLCTANPFMGVGRAHQCSAPRSVGCSRFGTPALMRCFLVRAC